MNFDLAVDVSSHGPLFDGFWGSIMHDYRQKVEDRLGDESVRRIRAYLPTQYMYLGHNGGNPHDNPVPENAGYLVSTIHSHRDSPESVLVTDGGYPTVIYGPWIEGIAPGNFYLWPGRVRRGLSPRFPGYHAFQKVSYEVEMVAADLAEEELPPYLAALND